MAFTESFTRERSREMTFTALVPWSFQIQTLRAKPKQYPESYPNPNEKLGIFYRLAKH